MAWHRRLSATAMRTCKHALATPIDEMDPGGGAHGGLAVMRTVDLPLAQPGAVLGCHKFFVNRYTSEVFNFVFICDCFSFLIFYKLRKFYLNLILKRFISYKFFFDFLLFNRSFLFFQKSFFSKRFSIFFIFTPLCMTHDRRTHGRRGARRTRTRLGRGTLYQPCARPPLFRAELLEWSNSDDGYSVIDTTGIILWVNSALCHHLGYTREALINENIRILMPAAYSHQHDQFLKRCAMSCAAPNSRATC